jgi:HPt (histidine-containing phosphotransfer) domain-containing protein
VIEAKGAARANWKTLTSIQKLVDECSLAIQVSGFGNSRDRIEETLAALQDELQGMTQIDMQFEKETQNYVQYRSSWGYIGAGKAHLGRRRPRRIRVIVRE